MARRLTIEEKVTRLQDQHTRDGIARATLPHWIALECRRSNDAESHAAMWATVRATLCAAIDDAIESAKTGTHYGQARYADVADALAEITARSTASAGLTVTPGARVDLDVALRRALGIDPIDPIDTDESEG